MLQSSNFHAEPAGYATSLFQYIRHFKNISCLTKCVILLLDILETWFWYQTTGFWAWGIIWDHFQELQINLKVKNRVEGLFEAKDNFKEWFCNFGSEHTRDLILTSQQMFLGSRNHLGSYSRASEVSKGQEQCGGAVRGQEQLQGVK